jgi:hypothetical protein
LQWGKPNRNFWMRSQEANDHKHGNTSRNRSITVGMFYKLVSNHYSWRQVLKIPISNQSVSRTHRAGAKIAE